MQTAYALHIGINALDPSSYNGRYGSLSCAESDARKLSQIGYHRAYCYSTTLLTQCATKYNLTRILGYIASLAKPGDFFLLTFSGHGSTKPDDDGEEEDKYDEALCLYDGLYTDDDLNELLALFKKGVRIVIVSDCCYGGGIYRHNEDDDKLRKSLYVERTKYEIMASVIMLLACGESEVAKSGLRASHFSHALFNIWDDGNYNGNYVSLLEDLRKALSGIQEPVIKVVGQYDIDFLNAHPFSYYTS